MITGQSDLRYSARDLKNIHTLPEIQQRVSGPGESATGIMQNLSLRINFIDQSYLVLPTRGGEIGCFIICIASNFFFCSYDGRISLNNLLSVLSFLLIALFCVLLQICSLIQITFCAKLLSWEISSCYIITFLCVYLNILSPMVQFFNFAKCRH